MNNDSIPTLLLLLRSDGKTASPQDSSHCIDLSVRLCSQMIASNTIKIVQ
jgi:hypothetical protein